MTPSGGRDRRSAVVLLALKGCLAAVSLSMVLVVFEVGLRIAGYEAIYEIYSKPSALWVADPLLGWRHVPDSEDVFVGPRPWPIEFETPVRINGDGLRGPEVPPRDQDDLRLLFLGDSMVAAFEVVYDETFPVETARALSARLDRDVRAINAGVRGYGTDQSLLYFRERGRAFEPDAVVFFHSRNDLVNNRTIHLMRRAFGKGAFVPESDGSLSLVGVPVPEYPACCAWMVAPSGEIVREDGFVSRTICNLQMILFDRSALFSFITLRIDWDPTFIRDLYYFAIPKAAGTPRKGALREYGRRVTLELLSTLRREVEASGARLLVVGERDQLEELDFAALSERGIATVALPPFDPSERDLYHFVRDSHYNERGHERVAEALAPVLERMLYAPRADSAADEAPETHP